jgi:hypothetical protein
VIRGRDLRASLNAAGLIFTGEMYGVQLDQLALVLQADERRAAAIAAQWRTEGKAELARLSPGPRWVWLTQAGLATCGLPYHSSVPGLSRLAHLRAVTAVRLALESTPQYAVAGAHWRSERRLRSRIGRRLGVREHLPDAELHWPEGSAVAWAGECWAIEAELTAKPLARTAAIMRELLTPTGDYGCPAADVLMPGQPPRHTRAIYLCSAAAMPVVRRARAALGGLASRIEIRGLPDSAELTPRPTDRPGHAAARQHEPGHAAARQHEPGHAAARQHAPGYPQPSHMEAGQ